MWGGRLAGLVVTAPRGGTLDLVRGAEDRRQAHLSGYSTRVRWASVKLRKASRASVIPCTLMRCVTTLRTCTEGVR